MRSKSYPQFRREAIAEYDRDRSSRSALAVPRYRTADLLGDSPWIVIEHGSSEYRLRVTRLGKLILTK